MERPAADQLPPPINRSPASRSLQHGPAGAGSAAERVMVAELRDRSEPGDALSMMVSSMVRMVQAGKASRASVGRWSAS